MDEPPAGRPLEADLGHLRFCYPYDHGEDMWIYNERILTIAFAKMIKFY